MITDQRRKSTRVTGSVTRSDDNFGTETRFHDKTFCAMGTTYGLPPPSLALPSCMERYISVQLSEWQVPKGAPRLLFVADGPRDSL